MVSSSFLHELSDWERAVAKVIRAIPKGKTLGYGQVALLAGKPGGARAVVRALRSLDAVPWWRVIRSDGSLAPQVASEQGKRLRAEGVVLVGRRITPAARGLPRPSSPRAAAPRRR